MHDSSVLDKILASKREELAARKGQVLPGRADPVVRDFEGALRAGPRPRLIAEIKRASPSAGLLRADFDPAQLGRSYEAAGAAALSVLTEEKFFLGSLDHLREARAACHLPALRKDFLIDEWQIEESFCAGSDAVLLIAAALERERLRSMLEQAGSFGMAAIVEVHSEAEVELALEAGASIIGINNRNLQTLEVDLEVTRMLRPMIPPDVVVVSESGIRRSEDVRILTDLGAHAILVGEAFMRAPDPGAAARDLLESFT
jgi:indole-3-glycerol phosphate synthase